MRFYCCPFWRFFWQCAICSEFSLAVAPQLESLAKLLKILACHLWVPAAVFRRQLQCLRELLGMSDRRDLCLVCLSSVRIVSRHMRGQSFQLVVHRGRLRAVSVASTRSAALCHLRCLHWLRQLFTRKSACRPAKVHCLLGCSIAASCFVYCRERESCYQLWESVLWLHRCCSLLEH